MSMTDPIADLLTRIRNAQSSGHATTTSPSSMMRKKILEVLAEEGYIRGYSEQEASKNIKTLTIELKYAEGKPVIQELVRISKPGRRVYTDVRGIKPVHSGLGINILSTSQGVMSEITAREKNLGGEVICQVF